MKLIMMLNQLKKFNSGLHIVSELLCWMNERYVHIIVPFLTICVLSQCLVHASATCVSLEYFSFCTQFLEDMKHTISAR